MLSPNPLQRYLDELPSKEKGAVLVGIAAAYLEGANEIMPRYLAVLEAYNAGDYEAFAEALKAWRAFRRG